MTLKMLSGAALAVNEAKATAIDAYASGASLISVEMSGKVIANVEKPTTMRAPMGQFANLREHPAAAFRDVNAPNADPLYANAFTDVSEEPSVAAAGRQGGLSPDAAAARASSRLQRRVGRVGACGSGQGAPAQKRSSSRWK